LRQLVRRGKHSSRKVTRARILLLAATGATDEQIVAALSCGINTVERTRRRFVEEGLGCLQERPRRGQARKLTGKQEAHLVAIACSTPPLGRARWTLSLLADKVVELKFATTIARETIRQLLKKRTQAVAEKAMVHSRGQRRVRRRDGRRVGLVRGR